MANIILDYSTNNLFQRTPGVRTYKFKDIGTSNFKFVDGNKVNALNTSNYDINAINAALDNLFEFRVGQAILEPLYGNDLYRYLYEPINKYTAEKIGRTITNMIETWEPRIQIVDIPIVGMPDENMYHITVKYIIPELNRSGEYQMNLKN